MSFSAEQLRQLESVLQHALNPDNTQRRAAEDQMEKLWNESREPLVGALVQLLRSSATSEQSRSLIAIILRRRLPNSEPILFTKLADQLQNHVKTELLTAITVEPSNYVRGLICDTVAELAEVLLHKDDWNELIPFVFSLCANDKEHLRTAGVELFGRLAENCSQSLAPHLKVIHAMIGKTLTSDASLPVRAQGVITCCKTIVHSDVDDQKTINNFQPFLPELLKVLSNVLNAKQYGPAKKMMSAMVELCTEEAKFMRPFLDNWAKAMLAIGQTTTLDDGIRQFAMETLVGLAEGAPGMLRKSESAVTSAVHLGLSLMLDVEDDPDWARNPDTPELYDNSNFDHGEVSIDRIAVAIGPKICPIILPILQEFVKRPDWKFRHAGLRALSQAGESVPLKDLPLKELCGFVSDAHPRVRYAACHCLGQLSSDFAPDIQKKYHKIIIPALLIPLAEFPYPRIQNYAAAALFNFIDKCSPEIFSEYCEPVLLKLLEVLKNGANPVKAQAMTTMAAVAGAAPEEFPKYYDAIVPLIKHVIVHANGKENAVLRSRAMESVTFIGMQCREKFASDAKELMGIFIDMMRSGHIQPDDTSHQYMLQACARICSAVGKDFAPVLPLILPAVFEAALKKEDWSQAKIDGDEDTSDLTPSAVRMSNRGLSSSLEDKAVACSMICSFVHDLKEAYFPFVTQTGAIMVPLMSYMLHDDVRNYACACAPDLFDSAVKAMKAGMPNATPEYVRGIFGRIVEKMLKCFTEEPDAEIIITLVNGIKMMVELAEPELARELIDEKGLNTIGMALMKVLTQSDERITNREKLRDEDEDFDEETYERIVELNEGEDELALSVSECMGSLIQSHRALFLGTWEMLLPAVLRMLAPTSTGETRRIAVFLFDDVVQYCGVAATKYFPQFVPALIQYSSDDNVELRQGAAYGLGMCAEHGAEHFAPYAEAACKVMVDMIGKPDSKNDDNASPTDNMVSAVGRIAIHQNQPSILPMWLSMLPLTTDQVEANWCYTQLCKLVEQNNTHLLGADFRNLPQVVRVLVDAYGTPMCSEELEPRVVAIIKKLQGLPPQVLTALVASLPEPMRTKLQEIAK